MKKIFSIARVELSTLFFSPVAWFIIVIFVFHVNYSFAEVLDTLLNRQEYGGRVSNLTFSLFADWNSVFIAIKDNLYLYIPLLTMGLMSREYSSGSIKLLYSSPITDTSIIIGKYLSIIIFALLLSLSFLPLAFLSDRLVENADIGFILSGILGLFLLFCAYSAVGLYMSTLTSYQIVAAILTLAALAFFSNIGELAQDIYFLNDLTYWLSMAGRVNSFIAGLISSADVIYFFIMIFVFLSMSVLKLKLSKERKSWSKVVTLYSGVFALAIVGGYFSSAPQFISYFDSTDNQRNTVSELTQEFMMSLDSPLKITTYVNLADNNAWVAVPRMVNKDLDWFKKYQRFKPDMTMDYVYYYDEPLRNYGYRAGKTSAEDLARTLSKAFGMNFEDLLPPTEIRQLVDLSPEQNSLVRRVETKDGSYCYLRIFDDMTKYPSEREVMGALSRLISTPPKIAFIEAQGMGSIKEQGDIDFSDFSVSLGERNSLINQGYDVVSITEKEMSERKLSELADIIVLPSPKVPLQEKSVERILEYIEEGHNLLIAYERESVQNLTSITNALRLKIMDGLVVQSDKRLAPSLIPAKLTMDAFDLSDMFYNVGRMPVSMPSTVGIDYYLQSPFRFSPIAATNKLGSWNEHDYDDIDIYPPSYNARAGEIQRPIATAAALERTVHGRDQKIIVLGDNDNMTNKELSAKRKNLKTQNGAFVSALFSYLSSDQLPAKTFHKSPQDNVLLLDIKHLKVVKLYIIWTLPILLSLLGSFIYIRRSRA